MITFMTFSKKEGLIEQTTDDDEGIRKLLGMKKSNSISDLTLLQTVFM